MAFQAGEAARSKVAPKIQPNFQQPRKEQVKPDNSFASSLVKSTFKDKPYRTDDEERENRNLKRFMFCSSSPIGYSQDIGIHRHWPVNIAIIDDVKTGKLANGAKYIKFVYKPNTSISEIIWYFSIYDEDGFKNELKRLDLCFTLYDNLVKAHKEKEQDNKEESEVITPNNLFNI